MAEPYYDDEEVQPPQPAADDNHENDIDIEVASVSAAFDDDNNDVS